MGIIAEYRVVLPMAVDEYRAAQLYCVAEASKDNTGGGEGIEVLKNEPFDLDIEPVGSDKRPLQELRANGQKFTTGQYTHKIYHLESKVPGIVRAIAPSGSLKIHEKAWNAYPYCRTIVTNPDYMKESFHIIIETFHAPDRGTAENIHDLPPEKLKDRKVETIDIARDRVSGKDYKEKWDPNLFKSVKTNRGPLSEPDWKMKVDPVMCAYKLVTIKFKWFGLQRQVEKLINNQERRLFLTFHRQVFCQIDQWYGLGMDDIRRIEEQTKHELDEQRRQGGLRGMAVDDD